MNKLKTQNLTLSALLVALTLVILALNTLLPISTLSILTIASAIIPIAIIRASTKNAFLVYIASSFLGFLILPKDIIVLYILFFGIYGIIKYYIEKLNKLTFEIILKLVFSSIILAIYYLLFSSFVDISIINLPLYLIFIVANILFLIYDYALTLIISFYINKIHSRI